MKRPKKGEYSPFHATYIEALPSRGTAKTLLRQSWKAAQATFGAWPEDRADFAYAEGKWTVKQLLIHLIDAERVFALRALWFMRGDRAALPGFNQDFWMEYADVSQRSVKSLMKEWKAVRENTLALLEQCDEKQETMRGTAGNFATSVRAMFYIIAGHHLHHQHVFQARYMPHL